MLIQIQSEAPSRWAFFKKACHLTPSRLYILHVLLFLGPFKQTKLLKSIFFQELNCPVLSLFVTRGGVGEMKFFCLSLVAPLLQAKAIKYKI